MYISKADKYKVIALGLGIQSLFPNSVINCNMSATFVYSKLRMSARTYKKYFNLAIKAKVLIPKGQHYQFIGYTRMYKQLQLVDSHISGLNHVVNSRDKSNFSFKDYYEFAREVVYLNYFKQQQHIIDLKTGLANAAISVNNGTKHPKGANKFINQLIRGAKKVGQSVSAYAACILADYNSEIITGSYKLSSLFGYCQRTANRILNKLVEKQVISRTIISDRIDLPVNCGSYEVMWHTFPKGNFFPRTNGEGFIVVVGSVIGILPGKAVVGDIV